MKKLFLAVLLSTVYFTANAQTQQGDWFVGGAVGYSKGSLNSDTKESKSLVINPSIGTFVSNSLAVGISLGYNNTKSEYKDYPSYDLAISKTKIHTYFVSPFVRKYWKISGGLSFFGEASLPISFGKSESDYWYQDKPMPDYKVERNYSSFVLVLAPGFEYRVNSWLSVDTKLSLFNLSYSKTKEKDGEKITSFSVNGDTQQNKIGDLMVGVKFFF